MMKSIGKHIGLSALTVTFLFLSCSKSFLDKELIGVNAQSGSLDNEQNIRASLNACYAYIDGGDWNQCNFPRMLLEASSDNGWGANDYQDRPGELGVCDFTGVNPNIYFIEAYYKNNHEGVRNCNYLIKSLPEVTTIPASIRDRYIAEAKFLRAYFHFELVKNFGDDVLNLTYEGTDGSKLLPRSPAKDIYGAIIKDLKEAAQSLPEKGQYAASDRGRATRGAALGLLAKAYLFSEDHVNAEATAQLIISSGKYSLETRYSRVFEPENIDGQESLFEVNYTNVVGLWNGPTLSEVTGAATVDGGWGWFGLTSDLENAFVIEGDIVRRKATINKAGEEVDNEFPVRIFPQHKVNNKPGHTSWRYFRKYYVPLSKRVGSPWPINMIKQRFSEILLIHAEASAFTGKTDQALTSLNRVRQRVGLPAKTGLAGDALKLAIWNERRLELAGEGTYRWDDIRRAKIAGKRLISSILGPNGSFVVYNTSRNTDPVETSGHREALNKGYYFKEGVHELWPIPASAVNSNKLLVQNPGY